MNHCQISQLPGVDEMNAARDQLIKTAVLCFNLYCYRESCWLVGQSPGFRTAKLSAVENTRLGRVIVHSDNYCEKKLEKCRNVERSTEHDILQYFLI